MIERRLRERPRRSGTIAVRLRAGQRRSGDISGHLVSIVRADAQPARPDGRADPPDTGDVLKNEA